MKRRRILVMAYVVSPTRGSEYSVAWNYISEMSKDHDLTVLFGASGDHMGDTKEMDSYVKESKLEGVDFIPIKPNVVARSFNYFNKKGLIPYLFYIAYRIWHKQAYKIAKKLCKEYDFDLIHYVGMIGYREPGYLWKLGLPYIWGPVSGTNNAPKQLIKNMPTKGKAKQLFRTFINNIQFKHNPRLRKVIASTDILLTASSENHDKFLNHYNKNSFCIPENVIRGNIELNKDKFINVNKYNFIFVGSLDARKSIGILFEAVSKMKNKHKIHIDIVGDGPLKNHLLQQSKDLYIDNLITWYGKLPREKVLDLYNNAHLHSVTSVSEGNPTTIWEAMMHGVPTISFDHCGMHDTLKDGGGILIPIQDTYEDNVTSLSKRLDYLTENAEIFEELAISTIEVASKYTWDKRREFLNQLYDNLLEGKEIKYL